MTRIFGGSDDQQEQLTNIFLKVMLMCAASVKQRLRQFDNFNRWEKKHRFRPPLTQVFSRLSNILRTMLDKQLLRERNLGFEGVRTMHERLSALT